LKQEAGLTSENGNYSEKAELDLIKQIGQKVLELLAMHGGASSAMATSSDEPEEHEPEDSGVTPSTPFETPEEEPSEEPEEMGEPEEEEDNEEPEVSENFKVQTGPSCRTAKDAKDNPKNVRNPKLG
jgi:hypothetical protein